MKKFIDPYNFDRQYINKPYVTIGLKTSLEFAQHMFWRLEVFSRQIKRTID